MKQTLLTLVSVLAISAPVFAQQYGNQGSNTMQYSPNASKGIRISILKPILETKLSAKTDSDFVEVSESVKDKIDDSIGFSVGYTNLPVGQIGYTGQLSYLTMTDKMDNESNKKDDINMVRIEGNVAYTLTEHLYMKGGLNVSDLTSSNAKAWDPGIGGQVGLGFQITQNFGLDVNYALMNFKSTIKFDTAKIEADLAISGLEIGLTGTF